MLLTSGATPSAPDRFVLLISIAPDILVEISHFLSSILGVVLVLMAFGLRSRLDAAWTGSMLVALAAAVLAIFKGFNWEESVALLAFIALILPFHEAFPRRARLSRMEVTPA